MKIFVLNEVWLKETLDSLNLPFELVMDPEDLKNRIEENDIVFIKDNLEWIDDVRSMGKRVNIILISDSEKHCAKAFSLHVSGYLTMPVSKENILEELDNLRYGNWTRAFVHCFGNFDLMVDGTSVLFPRKKSKEILAYLVCNRGRLVSVDEIVEHIFGEITEKNRRYVYVLKFEAVKVLKEFGLDKMIRVVGNKFCIQPKYFDCDFYEYVDGNKDIPKDQFMKQYKWGETVLDELGQ